MKITALFKRYAKVSLSTLALGFGLAAGVFGNSRAANASVPAHSVVQQAQTPKDAPAVHEGATFWKHPEYGAVLEVWEDPQAGLRGKLVSLDLNDNKVREIIGRILEKETKNVTDDDINGFVGMEGDLTLKRLGENHWKGSMYWPWKHKSYGVEVKPDGANLSVRGFFLRFPIIGRTVELRPADRPQLAPEQKPFEIALLPKPPKP